MIILALGLFTMAARVVTDPDVWWHLRTGQLILQNHTVFHSDPYSFTKFGQPWVDHEWLSQLVIFSLYRVAGWGGLVAAFGAITAAAFLTAFLRCPGRPYVAGLITVWGALASVPCWGVRPQVLTLLLASVFLLILDRSYARPNLLWCTPPLLLLWVNLHAGYALGIALLVLFLVGDALDLAFGYRDSSHSNARFRRLALVLTACIAVIPLNPYGTRMYWYPLETLHSRAMQVYIGEWLSPDFHQHRYLPTLFMMLLTLVLPALSPRRLRPRELLLLTAATYMALRSVRHIPIYMLVAIPILSGMVQAMLEKAGKAGLFGAGSRPLPTPKLIFNLLLLIGLTVFTVARLRSVIGGQAKTEIREFPSAAVNYLAANRPPGPLLNHYNWGGYFIWKLHPDYPVYIDGRADVYGDSFLDGFASSYYLKDKSWRDPLAAWGVRTVVLPPDAPLVIALKTMPDWQTVFADSQAVVLIRSK
ncbi:MAG: hypothetical protein LAO09_12575 [Acidobacteriia bacterium]|nr:hypothetical protein [Terriglobia bacterium]